MLFHNGRKPVSITLELEEISIPIASTTKFLGVWIDSKLKWNEHVNQLVLKLKRNQHLLKKSKNMLSLHAKKILYFLHIQSHITYCLSIWGNLLNRSQLDHIRKQQLKCATLIARNVPLNRFGILCIDNLIKLENYKFGYKMARHLLPSEIVKCVNTDAKGCSLIKDHRYETHNKCIPNYHKQQIRII